jgi:hypothetical protein
MSAKAAKPIDGGLAIGERMTDGSVFAGISPDTGRPMFVQPEVSLSATFNEALDYARDCNDCNYHDWRVPTKGELHVLFDARAAIGGFNAGWYWSSSQDTNFSAWAQRFDDGRQSQRGLDMHSSLRLLRG